VIAIENALGLADVDAVFRLDRPGQFADPVEIGADDAVFGRGRRDLAQPVQLAQRLGLHRLGHSGVRDVLPKLFEFLGPHVLLAQLGLDGLELFLEEVLALALVDRIPHTALDFVAQLEHFELMSEDDRQFVEPLGRVELRQKLLLLHHVHAEIGREEVSQR